MHNTISYQTDLLLYIFTIGLVALALFVVANLIFFVLKISKVFYEKSAWIITNLVGIAIYAAHVGPAVLDVCQSSYCEISDVVRIEVEFKANNSDKYILITDKNGEVYTCYDFLLDTEALKHINYPGSVIYAKHSKLMLDYCAKGSQANSS